MEETDTEDEEDDETCGKRRLDERQRCEEKRANLEWPAKHRERAADDPAGSEEEAPNKADTKEVQSGHRPCVGCLEREPYAIECGRHEGESHAEEKASH